VAFQAGYLPLFEEHYRGHIKESTCSFNDRDGTGSGPDLWLFFFCMQKIPLAFT